MKYEDPKLEEYWSTLPEWVQSLINKSGIDICSLGMLTKFGDYYKNGSRDETNGEEIGQFKQVQSTNHASDLTSR